MPFTTVVAGTAITASWSNANNRDQTIVPFLTAVARDAAITSPVVGQVCYLKTNAIDEGLSTYTAAAVWRPPWNVAWGVVGYVERTTAQATITTVVDITSMTLTFTAIGNRRYKASITCGVFSSVANDTMSIYITDGANNVQREFSCATVTNVAETTLSGHRILTPPAGSAFYKLRALRTTGTGNVTVNGSGTQPMTFTIEDAGPSGQPL